MILTRRQFAAEFNKVKPGLGSYRSPLWIPETIDTVRIKCQWFICVVPITHRWVKDEYWKWCGKNMTGSIRCFSTTSGPHDDIQEEWWGFTDKKDLAFWVLRWS
jgi:hypothetical protein